MFGSKILWRNVSQQKKIKSKSPTVMSLTLTSLFKRLTLIVRRQQPDDKTRDTKKFNDDDFFFVKTLMIK